ncbi:MAG: DUF6766 family protein [Allosphingosinicella sp.]
MSFGLHWWTSADFGRRGGAAARRNETPSGRLAYLTDPQLWFESLQNWQREFLSTAVLVVVSANRPSRRPWRRPAKRRAPPEPGQGRKKPSPVAPRMI